MASIYCYLTTLEYGGFPPASRSPTGTLRIMTLRVSSYIPQSSAFASRIGAGGWGKRSSNVYSETARRLLRRERAVARTSSTYMYPIHTTCIRLLRPVIFPRLQRSQSPPRSMFQRHAVRTLVRLTCAISRLVQHDYRDRGSRHDSVNTRPRPAQLTRDLRVETK